MRITLSIDGNDANKELTIILRFSCFDITLSGLNPLNALNAFNDFN
jgi:hypothetical protein